VPLLVEEAEAVVFERGGAALGAVDLEVAAARDVQAEGTGEFVGFGFGLLRDLCTGIPLLVVIF
jgi:hypothetical protein